MSLRYSALLTSYLAKSTANVLLRTKVITRAGGTCLVRVEFGKARCRFHGGLSTGPKSEAGRARIAEAHRRRWRPYRERQADDVQAIRGTPMDGTYRPPANERPVIICLNVADVLSLSRHGLLILGWRASHSG